MMMACNLLSPNATYCTRPAPPARADATTKPAAFGYPTAERAPHSGEPPLRSSGFTSGFALLGFFSPEDD